MSYYPECNYTLAPNKFFDEDIRKYSPTENMVLAIIIRQTFGWGKQWDRLSISQLVEKTGLSERTVKVSVKKLIQKKAIEKAVVGPNGNQQTWYRLSVKMPENSNNFDPGSSNPPTPVAITPTKETITKEKKKVLRTKKAEPPPNPKPKPPASTPTPSGREACDHFLSSLKKRFPHLKEPNVASWVKTFDDMIQKDGRTVEQIKSLIDWIYPETNNCWWASRILSADKFRKQFDTVMAQKLDTSKVNVEDENIKKNKAMLYDLKNRRPDLFKNILIGKDYITFTGTGKELSLKMLPNAFGRAFCGVVKLSWEDD